MTMTIDVLGDIRQQLGAEGPDDTAFDADIATMSEESLFECWCNWNGFIGWSSQIRRSIEAIEDYVIYRDVEAGK